VARALGLDLHGARQSRALRLDTPAVAREVRLPAQGHFGLD
jgi:hypothetical protein